MQLTCEQITIIQKLIFLLLSLKQYVDICVPQKKFSVPPLNHKLRLKLYGSSCICIPPPMRGSRNNWFSGSATESKDIEWK